MAEEIAQDSLAALIQRWRRAGPPDSPEAFVFAIARRRAWRASVRQRLFVPVDLVLHPHDGHADPEAQVMARQACDQVFRALARMPRGEREALLLVGVGELEHCDAAVHAAAGRELPSALQRPERPSLGLPGEIDEDTGGPHGSNVQPNTRS